MPNFTHPEILILARSFIQVSKDACVGNDQSDDTFWMEEANECMADVANAQLMTLAPTPERKEFFRARSRAINLAESNKLKKLELEQMKLDLELCEAREAVAGQRTPAASLPR